MASPGPAERASAADVTSLINDASAERALADVAVRGGAVTVIAGGTVTTGVSFTVSTLTVLLALELSSDPSLTMKLMTRAAVTGESELLV